MVRVFVKASPAEGKRRLHTNTAYAHLWSLVFFCVQVFRCSVVWGGVEGGLRGGGGVWGEGGRRWGIWRVWRGWGVGGGEGGRGGEGVGGEVGRGLGG